MQLWIKPSHVCPPQVVVELIQEQLGIKVYARRYTPGGYFWQQHLKDAGNPRHALYKLLGPGGSTAWDQVIFQARAGSVVAACNSAIDRRHACLHGQERLACAL
jgi:hypothetical protein